MIPATSVLFDADRMRRYDRDGPRYTSYPTARQFGEGIAPNTYEWAAATSRGARERQPLSAYIHIPFCFSPCFYCGCNRIITHHLERIDHYVKSLLAEINFDLIYGLPRQTASSFSVTLDRVIDMRPDRLAVYGCSHARMFKAQRQIRDAELPNAAERLLLLQLAVGKLSEAGYEYIGMDHFALPGDSLALAKHNGTLHRSFQV